MKSLQEVFDQVNRADVFFGATVESAHTERFDGCTPLHLVANWGDADAIEVLVRNGADINKPGEEAFTPLHYAAEQDRLTAVDRLIQLGAANLKDRDGNTPAQLARILGHDAVYDVLTAHGF